MNYQDLTGKTFARLFVIKRGDNDQKGLPRWICSCACGNEILVLGQSLKSGNTKSCGCYHKDRVSETHRKEGHSGGRNQRTRTYRTWNSMLSRCNTATCKEYKNYGGRGIKVCDEWMDYSVFLKDMGIRPDKMTLDRIDVNGNYCKENCRWATKIEQENNRRNTIYLVRNGERITMANFVRLVGVTRSKVEWRLRNGWSVAEVEEYFTKLKGQ